MITKLGMLPLLLFKKHFSHKLTVNKLSRFTKTVLMPSLGYFIYSIAFYHYHLVTFLFFFLTWGTQCKSYFLLLTGLDNSMSLLVPAALSPKYSFLFILELSKYFEP